MLECGGVGVRWGYVKWCRFGGAGRDEVEIIKW